MDDVSEPEVVTVRVAENTPPPEVVTDRVGPPAAAGLDRKDVDDYDLPRRRRDDFAPAGRADPYAAMADAHQAMMEDAMADMHDMMGAW